MKNIDAAISLTVQNINSRFERSKMGLAWYFIEPILFIAIFYFAFSRIMVSHIDHFVFYLCIGMIPWTFLSASLSDAARSLMHRQNIVRNTALDLRIIPLSVCLAHSVSFLISFLLLLACLASVGLFPLHPRMFFLFPLIFLQIVFCYGMSLLVSILSILVRDILYAVPLILMVWFYGTPIFYSPEMVPDNLSWILTYNPFRYFVDVYRAIILGTKSEIILPGLLIIGACAGSSWFVGNTLFQKKAAIIIKRL
jgi:lipopolysaccharide transport system permease protein